MLVLTLFGINVIIVTSSEKMFDPVSYPYIFASFVALALILILNVIIISRQPQNRNFNTFQVN